MKTAIRLSTAVACMTVCHAAWAEAPTGSVRFLGAIMQGTIDGTPASTAVTVDDAPHRTSEGTLAAAPRGLEILDYFVDTRREAGIDPADLHLITRTYL